MPAAAPTGPKQAKPEASTPASARAPVIIKAPAPNPKKSRTFCVVLDLPVKSSIT